MIVKRYIPLLIIAIIFLSGCVQKGNLEKGEWTTPVLTSEKEREWKSDVIPALGAGKNPLGTDEDGPWNHRLLIAISEDGISWQKLNKILANQASVPDVIVDKEGNVRVYYVDFYNGGIVVAISKDLKNWNYIKIKGIPSDWVDPSVVILPDGRFRLYASYMPSEGKQNKIVSAVSEDGIYFKIENGVRYESDEVLTDPEVIYDNGIFVMYVQEVHQSERSRILMLTSEDGLNFKYKGEVKIKGHVPCIIKYKNGYRLYLHTENFSIVSYFSKDLKNWENPVEVLKGEKNALDKYGTVSPAVAELPDGSYLMVYQTWIEKPVFAKRETKEKEKSKEGKEFHLIESIVKAKRIEKNCYLLKYPDFDVYIFQGSCSSAKGKYSLNYGNVTFLFDSEDVYAILKKEINEPKRVEKLMNNLEKLGNSILLLESNDGINWVEMDVVPARDCSVPDIVAGYDGKLRLYYVSFPWNKIKLVTSENGIEWREEEIDLPPGWVDPEVVLVNGSYRLYTNVGIISEAKDGVNFKEIGKAPAIMDPTVFEINGEWYMIGEVPEEGMVLFSSEDGLNFKKEKILEIEGRVCDALKTDGGVYLYCHLIEKDNSKILLYKSKDGVNWDYVGKVYESDKRVADPTVTYFKGKYYMAVTVVSSEKKKDKNLKEKEKIVHVSPGKGSRFSGEGPWNERILIAVSDDGIKWKKLYRIISDQASVPDVIVDKEGYVRVYYVDFYNKGITLARSKDLIDWEYIKVEGIEHSWEDPSIVMLPDGRFRLYASLSEEGVQRKIVSAISEDGIHFKPEGVVYESEFRVNDPDVVYSDGKWVMVLNVKKDEGIKIGVLVSEDGLNFRMLGEYDFGGAVPCIIRYENGYRIYLHDEEHRSIKSFYSRDLRSWGEEVTVLRKGEEGEIDSLDVEAPSVARLEDGRYIMVYTTLIEESEHEKEIPKEKHHFPLEEIKVEFINSSYTIAPGGKGGTFRTGQEADLMLSGFGFNRTGGPLLFNHPSGIATDGRHLFLADTFNNRVLIWNKLPDGNVPPDVVLGQKDFYSNNPGTGRDEMNWPFSIATDGKHLVVSDVNNARILIWNEIPTRNGEPADIVLEGGGSFWKASENERLPGASWGVWTDGKRLVAVNTWSGGTILIWNSFPTRDNQPADIVLHIPEMGTPRHITSDGKHLIIGDHNAKVPGKPETGAFFWKEFPTSENQSYDFYMSKGFGWLRGAFFDDGKLLLLGGDGSFMRIWNDFPESENDEPDIELELESAALFPDDYTSVAIAGERIYISQGNMNRVICYRSIPTKPNQEPDFVIGAPDLRTNTLEKYFFIQNGVPASNGRNLFVASDFDRKLYVWRNLPDESGAYPDIVYTLPMQPWDIALKGNILALAGERTVYIWKELPLKGNLPDVTIKDGIGNIRFEELRGVAIDKRYFYLSDSRAGKIYIWEGLPDEKTNPHPKFILNVENPMRIDSDGKYLAVALNGQPFVKIYDVDKLSSDAAPIATIGGPGKMNLPQHAIVKRGMLFVADTSNNRVLVWNNVEEAISGKWPPDAVLGKSDLQDSRPAIGRSSLFFPGALSFDGKYLWVGEFKFSNRIVRFTAVQESSRSAPSLSGVENCHFGILLSVPLETKENGKHVRIPPEEIEKSLRRELELVKDIGACWVRPHPTAVFNWGNIEDENGGYDWTIPDIVIKTIQNYNLGILIQFWNCPETTIPYSDLEMKDMERYLRWLKAMVERYDGDGIDDMPGLKYPVLYYEVLNEPIQHDPENEAEKYARILKESYLAIKDANASAKVLVGGLLDVGRDLPLLLERGCEDYFDIINWHQGDAEFAKRAESEFGVSKPMWITEMWYEEPGKPEEMTIEYEREQAKWLAETFARNFAMGVDKIFHVEIPRLLGREDNPRLAYYTYKLLAEKIGKFDSARIVKMDGREIYEFSQNGKKFYIIPSNQGVIKLPVNCPYVKAIKLIPNKDGVFDTWQIESENGYVEIEATDTPILLEICS